MRVEELVRLQERIRGEKKKAQELDVRRKVLLDQLKRDFGCVSLEEAVEKRKNLQVEVDKKSEELRVDLEALEAGIRDVER